MNITRTAALGTATLVLAGCGLIPIGPFALGDITLQSPAQLTAPSQVVYMKQDLFANLDARAKYLSSIKLTAESEYSGTSSTLSFDVFVADSLANKSCLDAGDYIICDSPGSEEYVGVLPAFSGAKGNVSLEGKALDNAVRNQRGHVGIQLKDGAVNTGEIIKLTKVEVKARL